MRTSNLTILDQMSLPQVESALELHTLEQVPPTKWTAFSWSASRHRLFSTCERKYYLNYYGTRRVREAASGVISAVWWLKKVTSHGAWIGTVLHEAAQRAVEAHQSGRPITAEQLTPWALSRYHDGLRASKRGTKLGREWVILYEDIYGGQIEPADERITMLVDALLASDAYQWITDLPPSAILEIDEPFQSFVLRDVPVLGSVKVFAIPDVLLKVDDVVHIIDWKTGDTTDPAIRDQAGIYKLYAHETYGAETVDVTIVDLNEGGVSVEPPGGAPSIEEARVFALASIAQMVERMDDVDYHTVPLLPMTDDLSLCEHCRFKRVCNRE